MGVDPQLKPILNYRSPSKVAINGPQHPYLAHLAGILGALATVVLIFVTFCTFVFGHGWTDYLPLLPGYVAGIGYYLRAFGHFSLVWRRVIWSVSLVAHGGYGFFFLLDTTERYPSMSVPLYELAIPGIFCGLALLSSVCLIAEGRQGGTQGN
jgi:hypothetical protein